MSQHPHHVFPSHPNSAWTADPVEAGDSIEDALLRHGIVAEALREAGPGRVEFTGNGVGLWGNSWGMGPMEYGKIDGI